MSDLIQYEPGMAFKLGCGFDLQANECRFSPFDPFSTETISVNDAPTEFHFIEDTSTLSTMFKFAAEGIYDSLVFRGSAQTDFLYESNINKYSLTFIVQCSAITKSEIIASTPKLSQDAKALLSAGNIAGFRQAYGTHFASTKICGGSLYGVFEIVTTSEQQRLEVAAQLDAKSVTWETSAQFQEKLAQIDSSIVTHTRIWPIGIEGTSYSVPDDFAGLRAMAKNFPSLVAASDRPIKFEVRPLNQVPEVMAGFEDIPEPVRCAVATMSEHYLDYMLLCNDICYIESHQSRFDLDTTPFDQVIQSRKSVQSRMNLISDISKRLVRGETPPNAPEVVGFTPAYVFAHTLTLPNQVEVVKLPDISMFPLRFNTKGDDEMKGHKPTTEITAALSTQDNKQFLLHAHVTMKEDRSDWTTFEDVWPPDSSPHSTKTGPIGGFTLAGSGKRIVSYAPTSGRLFAKAGANDWEWHDYPGMDLIKSARCRSDTDGKETGKIGADRVSFNPIRVIVGPTLPLTHQPQAVTPPVLRARQQAARMRYKLPPNPTP